MKTKLIGYLSLAAAMMGVGSTVVASRIAGDGLPPFTAAALRFLIASPLLYALMRAQRLRWPRLAPRELGLLVVQAACGGVGYTVLLIVGTRLSSPVDAGVMLGTLPAMSTLIAAVVPFDAALAEIGKLESVNGRMQRLGGRLQNDEPLVVVDYAHTPDALEKTLDALRPIAQARGGELICMFGCGGDRDATKRPLMGAIAERLADKVVVTSDNPRSEDPQKIIDQIVAGMRDASGARRVEDRASAILQAVRGAAREDVVLLAGKGHEATQEIMGKKRAFSDQDHARLALAARTTQTRGGGE